MERRAFRARAQSRALVLTSLALASVLSASLAWATERPVALGSVVAPESNAVAERRLRRALEDGLDGVDFGKVPVRSRFLLSARLVKLESVSEKSTVRTTCVVSLTLLRKHDQSLHAVLSGRAIAEESSTDGEASREDALRGAVHSALSRLPEIVRSGER